jgi:hypothetical protein
MILITGFDYMERRKFLSLPVLELLPLGRPARSQSTIPTGLYYIKEVVYD